MGGRRAVVAFGALYALTQAGIGALLHPIGPLAVLELQTTLSAERFAAILDGWRDAGLLGTYARHYLLDFVHPAVYAGFLVALLARALEARGFPSRCDAVLLLPIAAAGLDLVENAFHVVFLLEPAAVAAPWVALAGGAAIAKWVLVALTLACVMVLAARGARDALR
jgi:hypothetical protein